MALPPKFARNSFHTPNGNLSPKISIKKTPVEIGSERNSYELQPKSKNRWESPRARETLRGGGIGAPSTRLQA